MSLKTTLFNLAVHRRLDAPVFISLEHATKCNLRCKYCPQSITPLPEKYMSEDTYEIVLRRLVDYKWRGILEWGFFNEPSLDDRLHGWILRMTRAVNPWHQWIYSNGTWLSRPGPDAMLLLRYWGGAGLDSLCVSTHGRDIDKVRSELRDVIHRAKGCPCAPIPKRILLRLMHEGSASINSRAMPQLVKPGMARRKRCYLHHLVITHTGEVVICVMDYHRRNVVGDLKTQSLDEIWRSYADLRRDLAAGRFDNAPDMCDACYDNCNGFQDEVMDV